MYLKCIIQRNDLFMSLISLKSLRTLWICLITYFVLFCFQAVETLKMFEKKDSRVKSAAATNLSFLYFLVSTEL